MIEEIAYVEWSEDERRAIRRIAETHASPEDMFVRKLVNATMFRNRLYEHTSNECEEGRRHYIYVKPYSAADNGSCGQAIYDAAKRSCSVAMHMKAEFLLWDGTAFVPLRSFPLVPVSPLEFVRTLLDHYMVAGGRAYESLYTVYDMDRNAIIWMLKETRD